MPFIEWERLIREEDELGAECTQVVHGQLWVARAMREDVAASTRFQQRVAIAFAAEAHQRVVPDTHVDRKRPGRQLVYELRFDCLCQFVRALLQVKERTEFTDHCDGIPNGVGIGDDDMDA